MHSGWCRVLGLLVLRGAGVRGRAGTASVVLDSVRVDQIHRLFRIFRYGWSV
mgnify:CR=1 FL=1